MIKHVILWKLKDELGKEEKESVKRGIKEGVVKKELQARFRDLLMFM